MAACGYQHIRMYDLASANPDPVINFEGITKNVSRVGFQVSQNDYDNNLFILLHILMNNYWLGKAKN